MVGVIFLGGQELSCVCGGGRGMAPLIRGSGVSLILGKEGGEAEWELFFRVQAQEASLPQVPVQ